MKENLLEQFKLRYEVQESSPRAPITQSPPCDVPLREPYGADSFIKKQARVIMAQERKKRHEQNMQEISEREEKHIAAIQDKEIIKQKKVAKNLKEFQSDQKDKIQKSLGKVEEVLNKKKAAERAMAKDLREKYREYTKEQAEQRLKAEQDKIQFAADQFKRDMENLRQQ